MAVRIDINQDGIDELHRLIDEFAEQKAQEILDAAAAPVDTGFLDASGYIHSENVNTFDRTWETGEYMSTKRGTAERRERVSAPQPHGRNSITVGWGAVYAWEVEDTQPFIYPALLRVARGN